VSFIALFLVWRNYMFSFDDMKAGFDPGSRRRRIFRRRVLSSVLFTRILARSAASKAKTCQ
jgi:hypothetical protein